MSGERVLVGRRYVDDAVAHLRDIMDQRAEALALALKIADEEYKRRDDDLNHAHARAEEAARSTVSRDMYDSGRKDEALRREELARQVQETKDATTAALAALRRDVEKDIANRAGRAEAKAKMLAAAAVAVSLLSAAASWVLR